MPGIGVCAGAGGGEAFGVGEGIGIVWRCCPCADAINNETSNDVSTIRVSGWVKDVTRNGWDSTIGIESNSEIMPGAA